MRAHALTAPISYGKLPPGSYMVLLAFPGIVTTVLVVVPCIRFLNKLTGRSDKGWKKLHRFFILGYLHSLIVAALADSCRNLHDLCPIPINEANAIDTAELPFFGGRLGILQGRR